MLLKVLATAAFVVASAAGTAFAQGYPAKLVRIIVPFPPGGTVDILGRHLAEGLREQLKVEVIVENRPGASGIVGSEAVARSAPDGGTLLIAATHHAINPALYRKLPYDTDREFAPLALVATGANALVINPKVLPARNVAELIAIAKKDPGKLSFGSTSVGGANHLAGELFKLTTGTDLLHIPYRGAAAAMTDLLGGHIPMMFDSLPTVIPLAQDGSLRVLGVTSLARAPSLPDVPTLDESGVKGFEVMAWFGLYMPAGPNASNAARQQLEAALTRTLSSAATRERFQKLGLEPGQITGEDFARYVRDEIRKWGDVIREAKIPQQ